MVSSVARVPLTRERVLAEAIRIADEDGLGALSMRRLGQALGVEAMSLYHHVANKADLMNGILDRVTEEIELPAPGSDWKPALRATSLSAHHVYLRHQWAANLTLSAGTGAGRYRYMEAILRSLREGGFSSEMAHHAYHALESHIVGFTLWLVGISASLAAAGEAELQEVVRSFEVDFPYLFEHAGEHARERGPDDPTEFEFGLDLILDGLEARRA
jgi:AcrR family transcriptional regulator